ncbi:DUF4870 domain-containing protein [Demequina capsici]|uniref:DUF4870 domain-containing protein n=1 Tax=Demequina capsici TaxID=3075620 RepID=A0AA96F8P1_9MICO|nr:MULTISPECIES: DUF4870 domain-containing protein [unclassified Demequina]WNM25477.1 DUF4870 domain-containing protein [Demequina sp. OYTSA14]WNM28358.1 DUF4870 domain-containing protein [Demequina sp. PMTSA13]
MSETPPPPPPPAAPQPAAPMSQSDERLYATLAHAGIILFGFLPPLIIWLIGKDRSAYVDRQAKEALNFSILVTIAYIVSSILVAVLIGIVLWLATIVVTLIFCIQAAIAANKGVDYRYPFNWRIIK